MHPVIRAIPTFGTYTDGYHGWERPKPDDRRNIPSSRAARMIGTGGIAPIIGYIGAEEG